jgi:hypothetical protein
MAKVAILLPISPLSPWRQCNGENFWHIRHGKNRKFFLRIAIKCSDEYDSRYAKVANKHCQ